MADNGKTDVQAGVQKLVIKPGNGLNKPSEGWVVTLKYSGHLFNRSFEYCKGEL